MAVVQKLLCRVESVTPHGGGVYTLEFASERPLPRFRPGQFLHLTLDPYDPSGFWPDSRVFSIASSPLERHTLRLSYAVKGAFTSRMERELVPGRAVWIKLPYGHFVVEAEREAVLIAGGTGITAFTAFIASLDAAYPRRVSLFYGARRPGLLLYASLIQRKQAETAIFRAHFYSEQPAQEGEPSPGVLPGVLPLEAILAEAGRMQEPAFYLAGPPTMQAVFRQKLLESGVPAERIRQDAWE